MSVTPSMGSATIADRLTVINQRLIALDGAMRLLDLEELERPAPQEEIVQTARAEIARCIDELCWLRNLPAAILLEPSPTDDELDEPDRTPRTARREIGGPRNIGKPVITIGDDDRPGA